MNKISLVLGTLIVLVVGVLVFNYFNSPSVKDTPKEKFYMICYSAGGEQNCKDTKRYDIDARGCVYFQQMYDGAFFTLCGTYQIIGEK